MSCQYLIHRYKEKCMILGTLFTLKICLASILCLDLEIIGLLVFVRILVLSQRKQEVSCRSPGTTPKSQKPTLASCRLLLKNYPPKTGSYENGTLTSLRRCQQRHSIYIFGLQYSPLQQHFPTQIGINSKSLSILFVLLRICG